MSSVLALVACFCIVGDKVFPEIGAGVGACGIVASKIGANYVLLTDCDPITMSNLKSEFALRFFALKNFIKRRIGCFVQEKDDTKMPSFEKLGFFLTY